MLILIYYSDDHGFTPLLWSAREGQTAVFDLLLSRGARITALNDGGDIRYWRSADMVHHVPKRSVEEMIVASF